MKPHKGKDRHKTLNMEQGEKHDLRTKSDRKQINHPGSIDVEKINIYILALHEVEPHRNFESKVGLARYLNVPAGALGCAWSPAETNRMNILWHHRILKLQGNPWKWVLCSVAMLCLFVLPSQALVVTIDLGWGYNAGANTDLLDYNLQEGSIIQVVMYNSDDASAPGSDADDNFDIWGDYNGPDLFADPYGSGAENIPDDITLYDPESVPSGHTLAYTTEIGAAINPNANGYDWYNVYEQFEILGTYDSLYIRVFGATEFPNGAVISSYWGLSDVQTGTNIIDTWYVGPVDEVAATQTNYFEVIPEPGTMALFLLGGTGLLAGTRRRKKQN